VLENGARRAIIGGEEVTCGCRKSHHGKLHNMYASSVIIRMIKFGRT
jgi:hypothetical protein